MLATDAMKVLDMLAPTRPVYGLRTCSNGRHGHESVFLTRTVKESNSLNTQQQFEIPLHTKIVNADAGGVGRSVLELLESQPGTVARSI